MKRFYLPNDIFPLKLPPIAFTVYCYLCRCRNLKNGGTCYPSRKTIAAQCGVSKTSVGVAIKTLTELGCIQKQATYRAGRQINNTYTVPDLTLRQNPHGGGVNAEDIPLCGLPHPLSPNGEEIDQQNEYNSANNNNPSFNKELAEILEYAELDSIVDPFMRETIESLLTQMFFSERITVDGALISNEQIRKQLGRISGDAVRFALRKFRENATDPVRASKYLMACLYNAVNDFDIQTDLDVRRL